MSQNGDHASQTSMNRGESDNFTSDSNKFNIPDIKKPTVDPDINSENIKNIINKLPHWKIRNWVKNWNYDWIFNFVN